MPATLTQPAARLLTLDEYLALPDDGRRTELVKGVVVVVPSPKPKHGYFCGNIAGELRQIVRSRNLGRVVTNDSGVVTEQNPDTLRGMDVAFYSFTRVPAGPPPGGYWPAPELVFEVLSPANTKKAMSAKVAEYHAAGVLVVCVLDADAGVLAVFPHDELPRRYTRDEAVELPELFPDFSVPVRAFLD